MVTQQHCMCTGAAGDGQVLREHCCWLGVYSAINRKTVIDIYILYTVRP